MFEAIKKITEENKEARELANKLFEEGFTFEEVAQILDSKYNK